MRTALTFAVSALLAGAPRSGCVTCGPTDNVVAPIDRYGDRDSQRQREQRQWELAQPTGAGARPAVPALVPVAIGGSAAAGLVVGAGLGAALVGEGDAGKPRASTRDEAHP